MCLVQRSCVNLFLITILITNGMDRLQARL